MNNVVKIRDNEFNKDFDKLKEILPRLILSKSMMIDIFEDKKGVKLCDTLKSLPSQNLFVLDCICNLFDAQGEEKILTID